MLDLRRGGGPRRLVALALHLRRFLRIGGLGLKAVLLDRRVAEHQHGPRHVPELVAAFGTGHLDVVLPLCERRHRVDQLSDRTRDREHDKHADGAGNSQEPDRHFSRLQNPHRASEAAALTAAMKSSTRRCSVPLRVST